MSFLLDTDTCSAHLKNVAIVISRFLQYTGRLHMSVITLGELYAWRFGPRCRPGESNRCLIY